LYFLGRELGSSRVVVVVYSYLTYIFYTLLTTYYTLSIFHTLPTTMPPLNSQLPSCTIAIAIRDILLKISFGGLAPRSI